MARPELSLVIPIYNEEEVLPSLDSRLKGLLARLGLITEVIFVDDGSKDRSLAILRGMADRDIRYRVLSFSRNFGHQRAISAGLDRSRGKAVVVMDADLQDPPEVILDMVAKWREGFDVVYGRRRSRAGESVFKLLTAKLFYRLFAALIPIEVPLDTGDFRLMSRRVVRTLSSLRESHRFVRGLVAWIGFKQTAIEYDRPARIAGVTKYPLRKMLSFALDGVASFSIQPLRFATYVGALVATASVVYGLVAVASHFLGVTVPGWTTTIVLVSFLFSVQFMMIGVLGEYVGRIYEQVKRRPLYVVAERINFDSQRRRRRAPRNLEATQEVAPIVTTGSVVVVGVPGKDESSQNLAEPPARPAPRPADPPAYFPKTAPEVHTLFGHPAPAEPPKKAPSTLLPGIPKEVGFSGPSGAPAPIPPDATAEIPLVSPKGPEILPAIVHGPGAPTPPPAPVSAPSPGAGPAPGTPITTERGIGALAILGRSAPPARPSAPPARPASAPPPRGDSVPPAEGSEPALALVELVSAEPDSVRPPPRKPASGPPPGARPGSVPPPPAALTNALADAEAAVARAPSRPAPARRPSAAEVPAPDAPKPAPLDLSGSISGLSAAAPAEPPYETPSTITHLAETPSFLGRLAETPSVIGRLGGRPGSKAPNLNARLAALKPEATRVPLRESTQTEAAPVTPTGHDED